MSHARALAAVYAAMWIVPLPVYAVFAAAGWMQMPDGGDPASFYLGVALIKAGFAYAFVTLLPRAPAPWHPYALTWWVMFAALELGQVVMGANPISFAAAGILSEALYFPLSAVLARRALTPRTEPAHA